MSDSNRKINSLEEHVEKMEVTERKIITFLTRNAHLDCEIPDIAFHLKLDEHQVQTALNTLYEKGVVTMRQNQYGRAFWYFVPQRSSMPFETLSTPIPEEILEMDGKQSGMSSAKKIAIVSSIIATLSLTGLIGFAVWSIAKEKKLRATITTELQSTVKQEEFANVVNAVEKRIVKIETELKKTMVRVDSLKDVISQMQVQKESVPAGKVTKKKR